MKAIIIILISLVAIGLVVLFFIRNTKKKKAEEKKQALERTKKREAADKANLERWKGIYSTISVTKLSIPDDFLSQIISFETCWDNEKIFVECPTDGHWQVIKNFLERQEDLLPEVAKNENAFLEFKAYSKKFLEKWIGIAKEKEGCEEPGNFWGRFFSNVYGFRLPCGNEHPTLEVKVNYELFFELMLFDVRNGTNSITLRATMNDIDMFLHVRLFVHKLEISDLYKNLIQKEKDRHDKKFVVDLEEFRTKGAIDEQFLTFIKTHPNPKERLLSKEVFDELILEDLKSKFFPDQSLSSIPTEVAMKLIQAYSNFTLKLLE